MQAWQVYELESNPDGTIRGTAITHDYDDNRYLDETTRWPVRYRNREEMIQRTGGSHVGISGIQVTVYLDGYEIMGSHLTLEEG